MAVESLGWCDSETPFRKFQDKILSGYAAVHICDICCILIRLVLALQLCVFQRITILIKCRLPYTKSEVAFVSPYCRSRVQLKASSVQEGHPSPYPLDRSPRRAPSCSDKRRMPHCCTPHGAQNINSRRLGGLTDVALRHHLWCSPISQILAAPLLPGYHLCILGNPVSSS